MAELKNLSFGYDGKIILDNFSVNFEKGVSTAILGPSGYGKTTLLGLTAGFLKPQSGSVVPFGEKTSFIFQDDRLLPWFTALENLTAVNIPEERSAEYLEKVGISDSAEKYPSELSGGMCRRLSIARALAFGGDVFFFDEPLRGLDIKTSSEILELIRSEISEKTAVIITHSAKEAFSLCERIIIVGNSPLEILADRPKSDFSDENELSAFLEKVI